MVMTLCANRSAARTRNWEEGNCEGEKGGGEELICEAGKQAAHTPGSACTDQDSASAPVVA
jgi:hypothetical protein